MTDAEEEKFFTEKGDVSSQLAFEVSQDKMHARVQITSQLPRKLEAQDVIILLNKHNIKYGFNQDRLLSQINIFNDSYLNSANYTIMAAEGKPPGPSKDGHIDFLIKDDFQLHFDKQDRADFRNIEKFKQIEKGAVLARCIPSERGAFGCNVYGEDVPSREPENPSLVCGENVSFYENSNEYRAEEKGIFIRKENEVSVSPVLYISGNAGIESGNVVYDGSIHVNGNIERGALLSSLGDMRVNGFIESNLVRVGQSLYVAKGINAQEGNMIYVGKNLSCTYVDNSRLALFGTALIKRSINSSYIVVHGDVEMSEERSVIVGSEAIVYGSILTSQIGNRRGIKTKITLGFYDANDKYYSAYLAEYGTSEEEYNDLHEKILNYKKDMERSRRNVSSELKEKIRLNYEKYLYLSDRLKRLKQRIEEYRTSRYNEKPVTLSVRDTIYPGVEINYRYYKEIVTKPLRAVVMEFSPDCKKPKLTPYNSP